MTPPPKWLAELADRASAEIFAMDIPSPIGCHYYYNQSHQQWEVSLFASKTETVGGECDGTFTHSPFTLNLANVAKIFDVVTDYHWQALPLGPEDEAGPHISVEGKFEGRNVWLRILAKPPERFEAGRYAKAYELRLEDVW